MNYRMLTPLLLLATASLQAQERFSLGIEATGAWDRWKITDPAGKLGQPDINSFYGGLYVRYAFHPILFGETGAYLKTQDAGPNYGDVSLDGSYYDPVVQVPVRLGARFALMKKRLGIEPLIGYSLNFQPEIQSLSIGRRFSPSVTYTQKTETPVLDYSLFETGLGISYRVGKWVHLGLRAHHFRGTTKRVIREISYRPDGDPVDHPATVYSTGNFTSVGIYARLVFAGPKDRRPR